MQVNHTSLPPDYHVHLKQLPYTMAVLERLVTAARARGVAGVAITEHLDRFAQARFLLEARNQPRAGPMPFRTRWWQDRMSADLDSYVELVEGAKERGLDVVLGIEADYIPEAEEETRNLLAAYPFDVVLGSVHWLNDWGVGLPEQRHLWQDRDVAEVYREYFTVSEHAVRSGLFDVLTHPDLVKIFGHRPSDAPVTLWQRLATALHDCSVAAEVSTAGWRKPVGEIYPDPGFIRLLKAREVPVTLASDAHRPQDVGHRFPEAISLLESAGYSEVSTYRRRVRTQVPLRFGPC